MHPLEAHRLAETRRTFLGRAAGVGSVALAATLHPELIGSARAATQEQPWRGVVNPPHWQSKAKRIIHLCMAGGPSHLETFDYKPKLTEMNGKPMPESYTKGQQIAQLQGQKLTCLGQQHPFKRYGESGQLICDQFPHIGSLADDVCIINSLFTEQINHDPAHMFMNTGSTIQGRPSMGSWLLYGLGSETQSLPGYVVLVSVGKGGQAQPIAARQWSAGFLPSQFQGVQFQGVGDPVLYLSSPKGIDRTRQREAVQTIQQLDELRNTKVNDPEILTRISQYEMAFRMQASVPELMDLSGEPEHIFEMYGTRGSDGTYAGNCLLARRMLERGVRFVQLYHRAWDHHGGVKNAIEITADEVDKPTWALITDLKQRGLLEDTLVIFGGEFGRTPMGQGNGRDHHIKGFSMMLAGAGIKGGTRYGATDELGYAATVNPVPVHDIHATMLHLFGIDHKKLTYRFQGLDFRLTGVGEDGHIVRPILA